MTAEIERLVAGEHADPHSILGAHPFGGGAVVRAFRPGAIGIAVVPEARNSGTSTRASRYAEREASSTSRTSPSFVSG